MYICQAGESICFFHTVVLINEKSTVLLVCTNKNNEMAIKIKQFTKINGVIVLILIVCALHCKQILLILHQINLTESFFISQLKFRYVTGIEPKRYTCFYYRCKRQGHTLTGRGICTCN